MDVYEIRRRNLLVLEAEADSLKAIGDAMVRVVQEREASDRAPDYPNVLSQHKGGKRIGSSLARLIEEAMKKPNGWMDVLQVDAAMEAKEAGQIAMNIENAEMRESWLSMGRVLAAKGGKPSPSLPFGDLPPGGKKPPGGTQ